LTPWRATVTGSARVATVDALDNPDELRRVLSMRSGS